MASPAKKLKMISDQLHTEIAQMRKMRARTEKLFTTMQMEIQESRSRLETMRIRYNEAVTEEQRLVKQLADLDTANPANASTPMLQRPTAKEIIQRRNADAEMVGRPSIEEEDTAAASGEVEEKENAEENVAATSEEVEEEEKSESEEDDAAKDEEGQEGERAEEADSSHEGCGDEEMTSRQAAEEEAQGFEATSEELNNHLIFLKNKRKHAQNERKRLKEREIELQNAIREQRRKNKHNVAYLIWFLELHENENELVEDEYLSETESDDSTDDLVQSSTFEELIGKMQYRVKRREASISRLEEANHTVKGTVECYETELKKQTATYTLKQDDIYIIRNREHLSDD